MVELFGEDSRNRLAGIYTAQDEDRNEADMVDDRTGNGDDVGQEGIEDDYGHDGHGEGSRPDRGFNAQPLLGPRTGGKRRLEIFFEGHRIPERSRARAGCAYYFSTDANHRGENQTLPLPFA